MNENRTTSEGMDNQPEQILLVDDNPTNLQVLYETLDSAAVKGAYKLLVAKNGETALTIASKAKPSLILLDIMMPGIDGYEVCRRLKAAPDTREIPIIFLSALDDTENKVKGLDLGAVDYVSKPFQPEEVIARVNTHLTINRLKRNLAEKNNELEEANEFLEQRVRERTAELVELNTAYERFVPREFLSLLNKESIVEIARGDQIKKQMTVMFADVRGWTTLSETMSPQENFNFINAYLKRVSPVIKEHNGFIDQYYGDGVMALFMGSADDAVQAAIAMHGAVAEYNKEREKDGFRPIGIGVGLHIGELMLGIIGSEERMQGAVVADDVNLAARLEGLTRMYGSTITLSETTLSQLETPDKYKLRFVDKVQVKGRKNPVSVHEVFDGDPEHMVHLKERTKSGFEEGLRLYYDKQFSEASVQFNQVLQENPEDKAARIYLERSAHYMVNGVPEDWTGVEVLTKK
jgi:two-component system sensor histidine kinase ChiS